MMRGKRNTTDVALKRREIVSSLMARRLTAREICENMNRPTKIMDGKEVANPLYMVNPKTNQPFTQSQIEKDMQWLRRRWLANIDQTMEQHRADVLQQIEEALRTAWAQKNLSGVARFLDMQMRLLGLEAPQQVVTKQDDAQFEVTTRLQAARASVEEKLALMAAAMQEGSEPASAG